MRKNRPQLSITLYSSSSGGGRGGGRRLVVLVVVVAVVVVMSVLSVSEVATLGFLAQMEWTTCATCAVDKLALERYACELSETCGRLCVRVQEAQVEALFQKIDCTSQGAITWDEFCTYMQLEYGELKDSYVRARQVGFQLPAKTSAMPHRDPLLRVLDIPPDGAFVCCSQDGLITSWSPDLQLRRCKSIVVSLQSPRCLLFYHDVVFTAVSLLHDPQT